MSNKKIFIFIFFLSAILLIVFLVGLNKNAKEELDEVVETKESDKAVGIFNSLTYEQKVGQIFMIGFDGTEVTQELESLMREVHPGAVLLLGKNIENEEQLKKLTSDLQKISMEDTGLPLLIAVDQEGGIVSRIDWVEKTPQSEIETKEKAYAVGKKRAEELKALGINLNLAPLLDVLAKEDFIYERGFVGNYYELGKSLVEGQSEGGIVSCIKHFPGYGGISFHPENNLAYVDNIPSYSQFEKIPAEMIMVSNVVYKELDEKYPFSFLREGINKIKGDYVVISDDLSQYSLLDNFSLKEIVTKPVLAGVDMLIFSGWRSSVREAVEEFKKTDSLSEESVLKIIRLKLKLI
jgi:beta-N-acetylhexosaminidase